MRSDATRNGVEKVVDGSCPSDNEAIPSRAGVWRMFDRVANRYDLLNRLLSLRQDVVWRNKLAKYLPDHSEQEVLDIATGTADVLLSLFRRCDKIEFAVGIDMAEKMLQLGRGKAATDGLSNRISFVRADAECLPFVDASFDAVTVAFGIRNMTDLSKAFAEMRRVLKPGGRALILEFSLPRNRIIRGLYLVYFRHILPLLGAVISGDRWAYMYLNKTVETFPFGEEFCDLIQQAGFTGVQAIPLTFGIATIYHGGKPANQQNASTC